MGISFDQPLALLLLPPLVAVVVLLHLTSRRRLGVGRRRAALAVRIVLLSLLVGALGGFQLVLPVDRLAVVYVVDLSDSVGTAGREEALAFLRESLLAKKDEDVAGIVAFGGDALVERLPSDLAEIDRIASTPVTRRDGHRGCAPPGRGAVPRRRPEADRPALGRQRHDGLRADRGGARGRARDPGPDHLTGLDGADEVLVERLTSPSTARIGEQVQVSGDITSTAAQPATVRLFVNGELAGTKDVSLAAGRQPRRLPVHRQGGGVPAVPDRGRGRPRHLQPERPRRREHDRQGRAAGAGRARATRTSRPRSWPRSRRSASRSTRSSRRRSRRTSRASPTTTRSCSSTCRGSASPTRRWRRSRSYVRDLGRGLVTIGGPKAYGAGGYTDTPLEETLPVDMGVRDRQKQPDVALVVVIDKSGSMDACHCNSLQRRHGRRVRDRRRAEGRHRQGGDPPGRRGADGADELGVVAFDQAAHWVVKTAPLGDVTDLQGALGGDPAQRPDQHLRGSRPGGGVAQGRDGHPASHHPADRRLVDGSGQYDEILDQMKADGITLSTVGAGGGANPFLEQLAKAGGGRFYAATNPASDPRHLPQGDRSRSPGSRSSRRSSSRS